MKPRYLSFCGCPFDDDGKLVPMCAFHLADWSAHPQPSGPVAFTPKNATDHNAAFSESYGGCVAAEPRGAPERPSGVTFVDPASMEKPKKRRKRSYATGTLDPLFAKWIRARGSCQICGVAQNLQCAHGISRSYRALRWSDSNAFCLCRECHTFYTHRPLEWDAWLRHAWGDKYDAMKDRAIAGRHWLPSEMRERVAELRAALSAIEGTDS